MLTKFHRMILRLLPGPFLGWLATLMFLLLMQFLIRYMPDLVGKGLPLSAVLELVAYSLAYMVVLAVPMSVLIASLMTFGKLAETRSYAVMKSAGVSFSQLVWPALVASLVVAGGMTYFNSIVLPQANFRAKALWSDIRQKKPGFALQPGVFYEGIPNYSILVKEIPPDSNILRDILIFDYSEGSRNRTEIKAQRGEIRALEDGSKMDLILENGELHRLLTEGARSDERYERLQFGRHRLSVSIEDFSFERSNPKDGRRTDRTMPTSEMSNLIDSLRMSVARTTQDLFDAAVMLGVRTELPGPDDDYLTARATPASLTTRVEGARVVVARMNADQRKRAYGSAAQKARLVRTDVDNAKRSIKWQSQRADRYAVEVHKKFSIALACLVFMLIGAPLGLSIRRGTLATSGAIAIGIFLFYWVTLVQGEKLADRGFLEPWVGMWAANIATLAAALYLVAYITLDLRATQPLRSRLRSRFSRRK